MGPCTFLASSILPCSARELGDSGRMIPAIRMMKPGTAAQHPHDQSMQNERSLVRIMLMAICLCLTLSTEYSRSTSLQPHLQLPEAASNPMGECFGRPD